MSYKRRQLEAKNKDLTKKSFTIGISNFLDLLPIEIEKLIFDYAGNDETKIKEFYKDKLIDNIIIRNLVKKIFSNKKFNLKIVNEKIFIKNIHKLDWYKIIGLNNINKVIESVYKDNMFDIIDEYSLGLNNIFKKKYYGNKKTLGIQLNVNDSALKKFKSYKENNDVDNGWNMIDYNKFKTKIEELDELNELDENTILEDYGLYIINNELAYYISPA